MLGQLNTEYSRRITIGAISDDAAQRLAIESLDELLTQLRSTKKGFWGFGQTLPPKGIYLWGGVGRGKSMVMDMFADCARRARITICRLHFHDFMIAVHDRIHEPKLAKKKDPARHVAAAISGGAKVICFDEMEVRDIADAMIVSRVIEGFFAGGGVMVSTSNRPPDDLYENGLHRDRFLPFIALLKDKMAIHHLGGDTDWRQRLLAGLPSWYTPNDVTSRRAMMAAFDQLSGGAEVSPVTVTVKGRDITFKRGAGSVAAVSFDEICAQPLAARDYIALAERLAGVLIYDIPRLDDTMRNEARRFMWLVDAFYDRKRFLVCSAETEPDDLYHGSAWKAEFPRTQSRLTEMTNI
jgi:cell division protein ZapE